VLLGLFTGTTVGAGYLLSGVPNVELMTLVVALCGGVLGPRAGAGTGVLAAVIYSLGSPYGLPVPLLLVAQAVGLGSAGVLGAFGGNRVLSCHFKGRRAASLLGAVLTGLGCTLIYDLLTNLAIIGAFAMNATVVLTGAVPFVLLHLGSNAVIFGALLPLLLPRLVRLQRAALVGRSGPPLVLLVTLAVWPLSATAQVGPQPAAQVDTQRAPQVAAAPDSTRRMVPDLGDTVATATLPDQAASIDSLGLARSGPAEAFGWRRPLWTPFARTGLDWLHRYSRLVPIIDGGLGASAVVLGEAGTANTIFLRDGIPIGTGHQLADDLWLVPTAGLVLDEIADGLDGWGGSGGVVAARTEDPDPAKAVSGYRGVKGKHETYFRSIHLLTPKAAWRVGFEFEESLDIEGYNFSTMADDVFLSTSSNEFPGHSRVRQSRTRLFRELDPRNRLVVEYTNGRLSKDSLPVLGAEHLELWDDGLAATMQADLGGWRLDTHLFWRNRDVVWGARNDAAEIGQDSRQLETAREGVQLDLRRPANAGASVTGLRLQVTNWRVYDSLNTENWMTGFTGSGNGEGQTARAALRSGLVLGGTGVRGELAANWHDRVGLGPEASLAVGAVGAQPWWLLSGSYGGRAPRSDELLTPLRRDVDGRELLLWPNGELDREKTARVALVLRARLLGFDLAVDGSVSRLRDGITWQELPGETVQGLWQNDLEMTSRRITGTIGRQGRFLGWGRLMLEGTWQRSDENEGRADFLPPTRYLRAHLHWENHFFQEDGILQLALFSTVQGEMADPWDVTRTAQLPSRTVHDLVVGFRLVGAHLSLGIRNLTGERIRLTSGARSAGQEMDTRLHWAWVY